jgi:hydrogenase nickel incorporation protein HypB
MPTHRRVPVIENILSANDQVAGLNRTLLDTHQIFAINIMASPGAGKTSVILQTIQALKNEFRIGVVEGDTAPVTIYADKIIEAGMPDVQLTQVEIAIWMQSCSKPELPNFH